MDPGGGDLRIPHMGWNDCIRVKSSPIFSDIPEGALFYFTHSYRMECRDEADVTAVSDHGQKFVAAVQKGHIYGTQFHPEKSQFQGLSLLRNFAAKVAEAC
jgi:glutamine amidotransferase